MVSSPKQEKPILLPGLYISQPRHIAGKQFAGMNEIETFYGLVENTLDALRIFQMCRDGRLNRVRRRLHERERRLIRSGSVFVFDEEESGIRRWTDGRLWSPSRILGNFLIYRELEKKGQRGGGGGGGKKRGAALTDPQQPAGNKVPKILPKGATESLDLLWGIPKREESDDTTWINEPLVDSINPQELLIGRKRSQSDISPHSSSSSASSVTLLSSDPTSGESLRALKSKKLSNNHKGRYTFKSDGLIKKTISIQLEGHTHHLVAYYSLEDFCRGHLQLKEALLQGTEAETEFKDTEQARAALPFDPHLMEILRQVPIPVDLMLQQNFRKPAALLASATSTAHNLIANDPDNGEKLITALEYGAINPSDLQSNSNNNNNNTLTRKPSTSFVPNGGIIFSSSPNPFNFKLSSSPSISHPSRSRRHSSFHPFPVESIVDPLNILADESSQLSAEGMEFFSSQGHPGHDGFSSSDEDEDPIIALTSSNDSAASQSFNFLQIQQSDDLGTEIFGAILAKVGDNLEQEDTRELANMSVTPIRGHDVLLSDDP